MAYFEGKLYYDKNGAAFEEKVKIYAKKYKKSTGKTPKTCKVHPSMTDLKTVGKIKIEKTLAIPANMFWIGEEVEDN